MKWIYTHFGGEMKMEERVNSFRIKSRSSQRLTYDVNCEAIYRIYPYNRCIRSYRPTRVQCNMVSMASLRGS